MFVILLSLKSFPVSSAVPVLGPVEDFNTRACDSIMLRDALRLFSLTSSRWLIAVAASRFVNEVEARLESCLKAHSCWQIAVAAI